MIIVFTDRTMDNIVQNLNTEESIKTEVENLFNFTRNMIEGLHSNDIAELLGKSNISPDSLEKYIEQ